MRFAVLAMFLYAIGAPVSGRAEPISGPDAPKADGLNRLEKRRLVAEFLHITPAQGREFWPIYEQLQAEWLVLQHQREEHIRNYGRDYFAAKLQLWTEVSNFHFPVAAFEAYLQTQWLGSRAFNGGTQPSITLNFDQSLPFAIDLEYNIGATRTQAADGENIWEASFQWAAQRDLFDEDFAVFTHGFYNAMTLPRLPNVRVTSADADGVKQNAVGAGFIWTVNRQLAIYGQMSGGTTEDTPSTISMLGFAAAF